MSDQDRAALEELIRKAAIEAQKQNGGDQAPAKPAEKKPAAATPKAASPMSTVNRSVTEATPKGQESGDKAKGEKPAAEAGHGCGPSGAQLDLTPPAPELPQPKYVCKEPKITATPIWSGQTAEFKFTVANEGEGPLAIRLKGG
jgi:hypothetical protein